MTSFASVVYSFVGAEDFDSLIRILFVDKTKRGRIQLFRYLFVGGVSVIADAGSLYVLTAFFDVHYLVSAIIGFILGTIVNYTLSVRWIFESTKKFKSEVTLFTLIGVGGLGINELILWMLVSGLGFHFMVAKAFSVSVVLIWSFSLRRLLFMKLAPKT